MGESSHRMVTVPRAETTLEIEAARAFAFADAEGAVVGAAAPSVISDPGAWSFISAPDFFNADYADLSGGADPAIAAIFGAGYADGLVRAPGWTPGGPNSMNAALAAVWKTNVELMVESAGPRLEATLIAGDLVNGLWPQNPEDLKLLFGDASTSLQQDLATAASVYGAWQRKLWSMNGVDTLLAAVGDHEIGNNYWRVDTPRAANVGVMKRAFGETHVDPLGLPATWNGVSSFGPDGVGEYDEGSYVKQIRNVLVLTVDVFRWEGGTAIEGRETVIQDVVGAHLQWIARILAAAEADASVDHVIVQGHAPVLQPVDTLRSSGLAVKGAENSPIWQLLSDHGTNAGGKVRAYLAGEVHATTTIQHAASGIVQIAHGASQRGETVGLIGTPQLDPNYMVFEVSEDRIVGREYTIINDRLGNGSVFEVGDRIADTVDTVRSGAIEIGTIDIDISSGRAVAAVTGNLRSPQTFVNFIGTDGADSGSDFRNGFGKGGNDTLSGGAGNDRVDGGGGRDLLSGGIGDDLMIGGTGIDTFLFRGGDGHDIIADFTPGQDVITLHLTAFAALRIRAVNGDTLIEHGADSIRLAGVTPGQLNADNLVIDRDPRPNVPEARNDLNGDGTSDLLWRADFGAVRAWQIGDFAPRAAGGVAAAAPIWSIAATDDVDGDGRHDIIWRAPDGRIAIWQLDGSSVVASGGLGGPNPAWRIAATGDFNDDGRADLMFHHSNGQLAVWQLDGIDVQQSYGLGAVGAIWETEAVADFNGDGHDDILWRAATGRTVVWQGDGAGRFVGKDLPLPGPGWAVAAVGDLDGNGSDDILWRRADGTVAAWLLDDAAAVAESGSLYRIDPSFEIVGTGDFDGNGRDDILWRHETGLASIWEMDGLDVVESHPLGRVGPEWDLIV
jgi:hypothetical protein